MLKVGSRQSKALGKALGTIMTAPKPAPKPRVKTAKPRPLAAAHKAKAAPSRAGAGGPIRGVRAGAGSGKAGAPSRPVPDLAAGGGKWLALRHQAAPQLTGVPAPAIDYWLYLPPQPQAQLPLLVMLHGCEQSAPQFAQGTRMNELAARAGHAVLYPQQTSARQAQRCWKWYDKASEQGAGEAALIAGLIVAVVRAHAMDASRVYICGMSAGAAMATIVALRYPRLIAALGTHSGPVFGAGRGAINALGVMQRGGGLRGTRAIAALRAGAPGFPAMPAIVIQGDADRVVRPINALQLAGQIAQLDGLSIDGGARGVHKAGTARSHPYRLRDIVVGRKLMLRMVDIAELGHAWSGGDASLPFNDGKGPNASRLVLDFFMRHRRGAR